MVRILKIGDKKLMGEFETLCAFHTPIERIATRFGVSIYTLKRWVQDTYKEDCSCVYQRFMESGNGLLNQSALALAQKDARMNIWLRKQWLGERDPDKNEEAGVQEIEDWAPLREMLKSDDDSNK